MKKRRIFVAYQLSEKLQEKIAQWQELHDDFPVRWTPRGNLHVTLVPPWYTENVDEVIALLKSTNYPVSKIPVLFETISLGPENKRPWLMWARGEIPAAFLSLRNSLIHILGREDEKRVPVLHTTLARMNKKQYEHFPEKKFNEKVNWKETIIAFSLIESHLIRTGVRYETLATITL